MLRRVRRQKARWIASCKRDMKSVGLKEEDVLKGEGRTGQDNVEE